MKNILSPGKSRLVFMMAVVVGFCSSLQAAHEAKKTKVVKEKAPHTKGDVNFTALKLNLERLKELGPEFMGPKNVQLSKMIGEVLDQAQSVVNEGKPNPYDVNKALESVKKLLGYLKQKKVRLKERLSSSSSDVGVGCNFCSELSDLESEVKKCCQTIKAQIIAILRLLQEEFPCNPPIAITSVPVTITEPGKYCVKQDLVYNGSGAAITVTANNVTINFHNHSLTLNNSGAQGVLVESLTSTPVREFVLENDIIQGSSLFKTATSAAVSLVNVDKATLRNIYTFNTTKGVEIQNSTDVLVENSLLSNHEGLSVPTTASIGAGILIDSSISVTVDGCDFEGAGLSPVTNLNEASNALLVQGTSQDILVKNSTFNNWLNTLTISQVTGMIVENCQAIAAGVSISNIVEVGSTTTATTDVTIRNSSFAQETLVPGFDGLFFINGSGALLENVIVDVTTGNDGNANPYFPGAIHIGCAVNGHVSCGPPYLAFNDLLAKNVIVRGANQYGLLVENGSYITFTDSQFTGASLANVFFDGAVNGNNVSTFGAFGCIIKNSTITNAVGSGAGTGVGVLINPGANTNAIVNCDVSNNGQDGIVVSQYALNNLLNGNSVFDNGNHGIDNLEATTMTYFNTSCNNAAGLNCVGVTPSQLPGTTEVAGSNICCSP